MERILITLRQLPFELVSLVDSAGRVACLYSSSLVFDLMPKKSIWKKNAMHSMK